MPVGDKSPQNTDTVTDGESRQTWKYDYNNCFVVSACEVVFCLEESGHLPSLAGKVNDDRMREKIRLMWMKVCEKRRNGDWMASNKFFAFLCRFIREYLGLEEGSKGCCEEVVDVFMRLYIGDHKFKVVRRVKHDRVCWCWKCEPMVVFKITRGMILRSVLVRTRIADFYLARHEEASVYVTGGDCRLDNGEIVCLSERGTSYTERVGLNCILELSVDGDVPNVLYLRRDPSDLVIKDTIVKQDPSFDCKPIVNLFGFDFKLAGAVLYSSTYAHDENWRVQKDSSGAYVKAYSHYKSMFVVDDQCVVKDCYGKPEAMCLQQFEDSYSNKVSLLILVRI